MHLFRIILRFVVPVNRFGTGFLYHKAMNFGDRLKEEMEYKGIHHKELASKASINPRTLLTYVGGRPSMPPADVAVRLAQVLGVSVEYLAAGSKTENALSFRQRTLVENFEKLSEKEKKAVESLIQKLTN